MKKQLSKMPLVLGAIVAGVFTTGILLAGNGPQSGSGGNCGNNGNGNNVWIYHHHGNGTWSMQQVPVGSLNGHASHGDLWYQTGCPLTGAANACQ